MKAGQAISLQVVNGELKLTPTFTQKSNSTPTGSKAGSSRGSPDSLKPGKVEENTQQMQDRKTQGKKLHCKAVQQMKDVTLSGGKSSGKFIDHGSVDSMDTCLDFCCTNKKCNLALMLGKACYTVECKDKKSCETSQAPASEFTPQLAIVRPIKKEKQGKGGYFKYDILLRFLLFISRKYTSINANLELVNAKIHSFY